MGSSSAKGKRKLQTSTKPETASASTSDTRQRKISQLFNSSYDSTETDGSKRRKLSPSPGPSTPPRPVPATVNNMYSNFPSSNTNESGHDVIDLTKSPSTPGSRRLSVTAKVDNPSPKNGVKRFAVKNLQQTPKSDPNTFVNETFAQLDAALTAIFVDQKPAVSHEELYRGSENLVRMRKGQELAKKLNERCKDHVINDLKKPLSQRVSEKNTTVLQAVLSTWAVWKKQLTNIRSIFFYLDRAYLLQTRSPSIYEASIALFRTHVFGDALLKPKIIDGACESLQSDRSGSLSTKHVFSDAIRMFHELQVYTTEFESRMLALSQDFIAKWADTECEKLLPEYVDGAESLFKAEMERCVIFNLDESTNRSLLTLLEHHIVERKQEELTNEDAIADLLDNRDSKGLGKIYDLLQRLRLGHKLSPAFFKWIEDTGTAIVFDEKEQDRMVIRLLELKQRLDTIWRDAFHRNEHLGHALRESFEKFINKTKKTQAAWNTDNSLPAEMIAKYVDMLLKAGAKAIPKSLTSSLNKPDDDEVDVEDDLDEDAEVNSQLDQVLDLFRFVHGKAVFEAFYKKDLARRLLMQRSASNDAETSMLTRLKTECGAGFTHNLEQMFKDIELAREEMAAYKNRLTQSERKPAIDINVNILQAAAWPTYPDIPVNIPPEIQKAITSFEHFYHQKHSGRKLHWKHALAHCQLKARFEKGGNKEMVVSSFQAVVLLLFNNVSKDTHLSYQHIKTESGLTDAECKRTLQSLACAKLRPLTKHPKGRDIDEDDTFTVNSTFTHEKYRVKINTIQLKETKEENKATHLRVAEDRQFETQAAIVRIMKSRKTIPHSQLVAEVIDATKRRGVLNVADIKKNIDKLIEKEYMEREENNTYKYLA